MSQDITAIVERLTRIETKLDGALVSRNDHEERLRALEQRPSGVTSRSLWVGMASAAGLAATITTVLTQLHII